LKVLIAEDDVISRRILRSMVRSLGPIYLDVLAWNQTHVLSAQPPSLCFIRCLRDSKHPAFEANLVL
jgi:hypothetical protein